jgi:hypothetical protein
VFTIDEWIEGVDWSDASVHVSMTREQIKTSPEYDPSGPVQRDCGTRHDHSRRPSPGSDRRDEWSMRWGPAATPPTNALNARAVAPPTA